MSYEDKIDIRQLNIWFGEKHVIRGVDLKIKANAVTAIMGPSGCGKSTLLRAFNRMNDVIKTSKTTGDVFIGEKNVYENGTNVYDLRRQVGMVFQKPNPLPKSIYENVAFGPKIHKMAKGKALDKVVEKSLRSAALWDEVKDRLNDSAFDLSGGQQQRLCIARALAVDPEVILMDEPCSALDPAATAKIEQLIRILSSDYTVVIVTHNMQQASRVSDYTVFLYLGKIIEQGKTKGIFENPQHELTEQYITGEFG
ncbi:MAG: phosphate ABC transporter ATP-binding protein PstB [Candidatus Bathyarchaeota archaeon]|nr:phosphate ABC transporter ATP-binding protein PstB [Candidatus Bathyarchaeota archaeon]